MRERIEFLESAVRYTACWVVLEVFVEDGKWIRRVGTAGRESVKTGRKMPISIVEKRKLCGEDWREKPSEERCTGVPWCDGRKVRRKVLGVEEDTR